jgi:cation diffusion facilitator family transporter
MNAGTNSGGPVGGDAGRDTPPSEHPGDALPHRHEHPPGPGDRGQVHEHGTHGHGPHGYHHEHGHADGGGPHHEHPGGVRGLLRSVFRPHSHDSADSVDSALEGSAQGIRAVKISLIVLGVTALLQVLVVLISGSVALLADTVHNFSDALTAVPLWIAFVLSRRAATRRYTYGYGRAEDLAGLFVVAMIALSAVLAADQAIRRLIEPTPIQHLGWVAAAGVIGFLGNEWVALYRIRVGRRIGSAALAADGLHARTDGLTSLAVVLGAVGVGLGFPAADPIIGLVISAAIVLVLVTAARDVFRRLMDGVDPQLVDHAERSLRGAFGVRAVRSLRIRWIGHTLHAEADVEVDPDMSLRDSHEIAHAAEQHLLRTVPRLTGASIHTSPAGAHLAAVAP